jgi:hypothetical protein
MEHELLTKSYCSGSWRTPEARSQFAPTQAWRSSKRGTSAGSPGIVQAAGHHIDPIRVRRRSIGQRRAAGPAEAADHWWARSKLHGAAARDAELIGTKHNKRNRRRGRRLPACLAMADAARLRLTLDVVTHSATKTSAFAHNAFSALRHLSMGYPFAIRRAEYRRTTGLCAFPRAGCPARPSGVVTSRPRR